TTQGSPSTTSTCCCRIRPISESISSSRWGSVSATTAWPTTSTATAIRPPRRSRSCCARPSLRGASRPAIWSAWPRSARGSPGALRCIAGDRVADLKTAVGGVDLTTPIIAASGTYGYGVEYLGLVDWDLLGAVVVKGLSLHPS